MTMLAFILDFGAAQEPGPLARANAVELARGTFKPAGTISLRSADQHPINVGDEDYDPLFLFGFESSR